MKEVLSKGRQVNMSQQQAAAAPVILPSRRRLMMQQLARHADHYVDDNQEQGAALDLPTGEEHLVQQEAAADHYQKSMGPANTTPPSLRPAKNGLTDHSNTAYNDDDDHHHDKYIEHYSNNDHILQQEIAIDHHQKKGSTRASVLRAKYGLPIQASYNDHHDKTYVEHYSTDDDHVLQQEVAADHQQKWGSRITSSTLQAAQAQVAELRALHSAMLNNYSLADQSSASYNKGHQDKYNTLRHPPADHLVYKSRSKKASKKKSKLHDEEEESMQGPVSSASSASSTADCFIRPVHEYPIFMPTHEDNLLSNMEGVHLMNRRSSVDNYEALMREERLNYIFDHENKRSFSGMQFSDLSLQNNNISCLHESLNLPPRSATALSHLNNSNDRLLHHMSLNLPQGSQHHLFNSTKQNPLFRFNDDLNTAAPSKLMKAMADQHAAHDIKAALPDFTGRQRALFEFLSEEPARMRAFNELASMEAPNSYDLHPSAAGKVPKQKSNLQEDAAAGLTSSFGSKGAYEPSRNEDQLQASINQHLHRKPRDHPINISTPQVHQNSVNIDHPAQSSNAVNTVSCDKCRPVAGVHAAVVPLPHSKNLGGNHISANAAAAASEATERPDQKKSSIKGWFFRGKKKHNSADHLNNPATTASIPASKDRTPINSSTFSATKEMQSSAASTTTTAATSQVFSGLVNSEAEKELEVAMAMDLMELKVLQANTKRDAAAAEVLELRLAMDSMAKKLVEVERHCASLKTQLMDVQAMQQHDEMVSDHENSNAAAAGMINNTDPLNVNGDDHLLSNGLAGIQREESDHYESDSQELRNERLAQAKVVSMIRSGISSGYGGSSSRFMQPTKAEFLNAVAEARVGVKQVSRVLLQHIQESKVGSLQNLQGRQDHQKGGVEEGAGGGIGSDQQGGLKKGMFSSSSSSRENERWGPIMMMCMEATRADQLLQKGGGMIGGSCSRGRGVGYCVEAVISMAFYEHFENVGFDKSGAHKVLDPSQRALAFYHSFLKLAKLTPTQLLTQPSPLYNPSFDRFCSRKMRSLGRAVGCPGKLWPDELARTFLSAARSVWLLHHLAFAYQNRPPGIFRVAAHSPFDARFMEILPTDHRHVSTSAPLLVSLMVMPGFFLPDDVIKCKVLAN